MLIRYVGLDVHKDSIKIAVAEEGREPARFYASIPGENNKLISRIRKLDLRIVSDAATKQVMVVTAFTLP